VVSVDSDIATPVGRVVACTRLSGALPDDFPTGSSDKSVERDYDGCAAVLAIARKPGPDIDN